MGCEQESIKIWLSSDGIWSYAYDAEDQLRSVTSRSLTNGAIRVRNTYDYRGRRISKTVQRLNVTTASPPAPPVELREWATCEERTFVYDDWNLIHETIYAIEGSITNITEIQYFWGLDLSDSLQGAGGVGGLLAVSRNGQFYFPAYDNNGNITRYLDGNGNTIAQYTYDAFGKLISQSGPLSDFFRHRFSTKHFDAETGLYYYGYRFYSPQLKRWLNRDPIEEEGGVNLYGFCEDNSVCGFDFLGSLTKSFKIWKYDYTRYSYDFGEVGAGFDVVINCKCKKAKANIWMNLSFYIADKDDPVWKGRPYSYPNEIVPANWEVLPYRKKRMLIERHEYKNVYWYKVFYVGAVNLLANLESHTFRSDKDCQDYADTVEIVLERNFILLRDKKQKEHGELWEKLK